MTHSIKPPPVRSPKAAAELEARLAREATALRANLIRRKQQVRARSTKAPEDDESCNATSKSTVWDHRSPD